MCVDLLRGRDGQLQLIEPYLYLPHAPCEGGENDGVQKLAKALKTRLEKVEFKSIGPKK